MPRLKQHFGIADFFRRRPTLLLENAPFSREKIKTYCDLLIENTEKANDPKEPFYETSPILHKRHSEKEKIDSFLRELSNATTIQEIEELRSKLDALKAFFFNNSKDQEHSTRLAIQHIIRFLNKEHALHLVLWLSELRVKRLTGSYDLDAMFRSKERKVIKLYDYFEIKIPFTFLSLATFLALMDKSKDVIESNNPSDYLVYSNENGIKAYWLATHALVRQLCVGSHWCIYTNVDGSTFSNYVYGYAKRTFYYIEYPMARNDGLKRFVLHAMQDGTYKYTPLSPNADTDVSIERLKAMFPKLTPALDANLFVYRRLGIVDEIQAVAKQSSNDVYASLLNILLSDRELIKKRISLSALIQKYVSSGKYLSGDKDNQILNKRNQDWDVYISSKNVYDLTNNLIKNGRLTEDSFFYKKIGAFLNNAKHHLFPETMTYSDEIFAFIEKTLKEQTKNPKLIEFIDCFASKIYDLEKNSVDKIKTNYPLIYERFLKQFNSMSLLIFLKNYSSIDLFETYMFFDRRVFRDKLKMIANAIENATAPINAFVLVALFLHSLEKEKKSVANFFLKKINELSEEELRKVASYFSNLYLKTSVDLYGRQYDRETTVKYASLYFNIRFRISSLSKKLKEIKVGVCHYMIAYGKFKNVISPDEIEKIQLDDKNPSHIVLDFFKKHGDASAQEFLKVFFQRNFHPRFFFLLYSAVDNGDIDFDRSFLLDVFKKKMMEDFHKIVLEIKNSASLYFDLMKFLKNHGHDFLGDEKIKILTDIFMTNKRIRDYFADNDKELFDFARDIAQKNNPNMVIDSIKFIDNPRQIGEGQYACDKIAIKSQSEFEFNSFFRKLVEANEIECEDVKFKSFKNFSCSKVRKMRFYNCSFPQIANNESELASKDATFAHLSNFPENFQNKVFSETLRIINCDFNFAFMKNFYFQSFYSDHSTFQSGRDFFSNLIPRETSEIHIIHSNFNDQIIDLKNNKIIYFELYDPGVSRVLNFKSKKLRVISFSHSVTFENCSFSTLIIERTEISNLRFKNFSPLENGSDLKIYIDRKLIAKGNAVIDFVNKLSVQ